MKNRRPRIQRLSIRMTLYFSVVIIIAFVALTLLISILFSGRLLKEMNDVLLRKMNLMNSELSGSIEQVQSLHGSIINDNTIRTSLLKVNRQGVDAPSMALVQGRLTNYAQRASYITSIVALDKNQNILHSFYSLPPYPKLMEQAEAYRTFEASSSTRCFSMPDAIPIASGADGSSITYLGHLYNPAENYEVLGVVAISLQSNFLFANLGPISEDSFDACFLTDEAGRVVYQTGRAGFESLVPESLGPEFRVYQTEVSGYPNWSLTCVLRESEFQSGLNGLYRVVFTVSLITLLCVIVFSSYVAKTVTQPIKKLQSAMARLGTGEYSGKLEADAPGEVQELVTGFNTMVSDINRLTQENLEKQQKEKEYEVAMLQTQLDLLQLQINPHFIHNTLNTMKYMAQVAKNAELERTITAFNALLRASMSSSGALASVVEEIENTRNYLHLQRSRYEFDIRFEAQAEQDVEFALLPKLILQPLVENALFHGIAPAGGGAIAVHFERQGNFLAVAVTDNGVGMPEKLVEQLMKDEVANPRSYTHIGLKNVNERLALLYGEESALQIQSQLGHGTRTSFRIPYQT